MTSSLGNPSVHQIPPQVQAQNNAVAVAQLRFFFSQLPIQIIQMIVQAIVNVIPGGPQVEQLLAPIGSEAQQLLGTLTAGLQGLVSAAQDFLDGTAAPLTNLITIVGDGTATVLPQLGRSPLNGLIDNLDGTAMSVFHAVQNIADGAFGVLGGLSNTIHNNLSGLMLQPATQQQAGVALANIAATTAANSSALQMLIAEQQIIANSGLAVTINFSNYANSTSLPSIFTETYVPAGTSNGTLGVTNGVAHFNRSGSNTSQEVLAGYNVAATQTDYQVVSAVFTTTPQSSTFGSTTVYGINFLFGRVSNDGTSYVFVEIYSSGITLGCSVSGTVTLFRVITTPFVPNALYQLVCGITGSVRTFEVQVNGSSVLSFVDTNGVSQVGSTFRNAGFGMLAQASAPFLAQNQPADMSSWALSDNAPVTVVGSGFRQYRASTTAVTTNSGTATSLLPATFYDTNQWLTSDLTSTPASNNKLAVSVAGWYMVRIGFYIDAAGAGNFQLGPVLYHNGMVAQYGTVTVTSSGGTFPIGDSFIVYCSAGDYLQPGYFTAGTAGGFNLFGEATGTFCYWEVALMNVSIKG